jgi:hypothetical protein
MKSNHLPIILAGLVCVAVVIAEEQRISALNKRIAVLEESSAAAQVEMDRNTAELKSMRERDEALAEESDQLRGRLAQMKGEGAEPAGAVGASVDAPVPQKPDRGNWMQSIAKVLKNPEMKKMMRTQQGMNTRRMYGDLTKELGLSQAQTDKVMEILIDRQMGATEKTMDAVNEGDPARAEQAGAEAEQAIADYDAQLTAVLGADGMAKLTEYERTTGDRMAMQQFTQSFSSAGQPLDDAQRTGLLQIMKEERLKTPAGPLDIGNKNVTAALRGMQSDEAMEQALETQRQLQQRVLSRAHTVLTPDQMVTFESAQKQQMQMQEMGAKMGRAMFGGGNQK